jgi:predicted amidophosphoribosyltransferase
VVRLGAYEGLLREAILEVKFEASRSMGRTLGRELGRTLGAMREEAGLAETPMALIPIPISFRRYMSRGIDHTLELARGVKAAAGGEILRGLARRHGPSQLSLPASQRNANVRGIFESRLLTPPSGWHLVIVDDVMTTGATMSAACRALESAWPKDQGPAALWVAVVGVTSPRSESAAHEGLAPGS